MRQRVKRVSSDFADAQGDLQLSCSLSHTTKSGSYEAINVIYSHN